MLVWMWILSCRHRGQLSHSLIFLSCYDRVSFRRKKKEDKAAKDAAKEDKGKDKPEKKTAKEEVRASWWIDGIFRQIGVFSSWPYKIYTRLIFFTGQ